jgi:hypothetical protein
MQVEIHLSDSSTCEKPGDRDSPPGPRSREWAIAGAKVVSESKTVIGNALGPAVEYVTFLIEWAGGEALTFIAGWVAHKVARGVRVRIGGREVETTSEPDILDILREAQGTDERGGQ